MLSRDSMSEGDKEQLGKITKDFYRLMKTEICESRGIDPDEFDRLVNEEFLILGQDAFEMGLVDTLGRWDDVKDMIERLEGGKKDMVGICSAARYELPKDNYWGERPKIAVIYALGECAMDTGIKARSLSKVIERAGNDKEIKAIVFRVDSPGGSATASDWVAEALKESSEKKPVIVSQGWLAGSGGYWISMYGDTIVAAPNSITGSIGVIGGWIYNKGFKEKLGMSTDIVQVGDHADLGYGISLPLLGRIPDRNLTEDERGKFEHNIKFYYKKFIGKVASGRGTEYDDIEPIAQGRVWSGYDGLEIGLVDVLGGMDKAIEIAKAKIGIPEGEEVELVEMPEPPAFNPAMFTPKLFGIRYEKNEMLEHLRFRIEHNGEAMPILPIEYMDFLGQVGEASM
jgi:protease-4